MKRRNKWILAFNYDSDDYPGSEERFPAEKAEEYDWLIKNLDKKTLEFVNEKEVSKCSDVINDSISKLDVQRYSVKNDELREFWIIHTPKMTQETDAAYETVWANIQQATEWGAPITVFGPLNNSGSFLVMQSFEGGEMDDEGYFENPDDEDNYRTLSDLPNFISSAVKK